MKLTRAKRKKHMLRAAGRAPNWVRTAAIAKSPTAKQRARHERRVLFSGKRAPAPCKRIDPRTGETIEIIEAAA